MMDPLTDMHLHTLVSDGENTTDQILDQAVRLGLKRISITDHDAIGAYRNFTGDPFARARSIGLELVSGIELDANYGKVEVHLLGYSIDLDHTELNTHLKRVQAQRRQRIRLQVQALNTHFGEPVVDMDAIFLSERDTVMKPHLYHFLFRSKRVASYKEFKHLLEKIARVNVAVERPTLRAAIGLIQRAGGKPVLAHPGYLEKDGIPLESLVKEMADHGLAGLETSYPYWQPENKCDQKFPDQASETRMVRRIRKLAEKYGLTTTRGSDAHNLAAMTRFARAGVS